MNSGWIKLWRSLLDDPIWTSSNDSQCGVITALLLSAEYEPGTFFCPKCWEKIDYTAGTIVKSYRRIATETGRQEHRVRAVLGKLELFNFVKAVKKPHCHALYIIENWSKFQEDKNGTSGGTSMTHLSDDAHTQAVTHPNTIYKKIKEERNKNKKKPDLKKPSDGSFSLSDELRSLILANKPDHKLSKMHWKTSNMRIKWAITFDRMRITDSTPYHTIKAVMIWALNDEFWASNIQSPDKLRKQFDRLEMQMRGKQKQKKKQNVNFFPENE